MSIATSYPGVYVQEISSGVRTITGVSTSVAAFVGFFPKGPMDKAVQVFNMANFTREFGGLHAQSEACYAIQQFFANGGAEAWVVRTATGAEPASVEILAGINGSPALVVTAINPGDWGNRLRVRIDPISPALANAESNPFNMTVFLVEQRDGREVAVQSEEFLGLTVNASDTRFIGTVVNDRFSGSKLVQVSVQQNADNPLQNGTFSGDLSPFPENFTNTHPQLNLTIGTEGSGTAKLESTPTNLGQARTLLEKAIQEARPEIRAFSGASVSVVGNRLKILAGPTESDGKVTFSAAEGTDMTTMKTLGLPGKTFQGRLSGELDASFSPTEGKLKVSIGNSASQTLALGDMGNLEALRSELENKIRSISGGGEGFTQARVALHTREDKTRIVIIAGMEGEQVVFTPEENDSTASDLKLIVEESSTAIAAVISDKLETPLTINANAEVNLAIGIDKPHPVKFSSSPPDNLKDLAVDFENAIRTAHDPSPAFTGACVAAYTDTDENRLIIWTGNEKDTVVFSPAPDDKTTVKELGLDSSDAQANVQAYSLGTNGSVGKDPITGTAQGKIEIGTNGALPNGTALRGQRIDKSGIYALEDVDLFNLLCIPRASVVSGDDALSVNEAFAVQRAAIDYCEERRAFFLMDTPTGRDEVQEIKDWLEENAGLRHKNAALYFPRIEIPDPLNGYRLRSIGACGTIAGLYARTDSTRGVWKAPAGTEATLKNAKQLEYCLTDRQNGTLNPLAINCLRNFPVYGPVCWGARTLEGSDQQASEWKYVPIRRLALFIEESLFRGTQWVVFEPNDEPLWAQIRLNIGAFMHDLFRKGAFQGRRTPREAYFVKCDKETTPQNDINNGIVNIIVGFAPLKPAEFVIISIQQIAGQIEV
ncbi:phage tail sheath C-terminal domain-containing protein [uncultured Desulfobacter sp.]|uniref:phage tail sheath family protein n=1 Tax=uncultured Desulfobacter sp. TaxID=240139 RepID=UPI002AA8AB10|nr:phage tail sheath C-terminal domain-containing protein [uncultured Desulfobacter sp.]